MFNNKVYHKIDALSGSVATLRAEGVKYGEIAEVESRAGTSLAQVIKLDGPNVTLQIFAGARGVDTAARVRFLGESMKVPFSDDLLGRAFTGACTPRDGGPVIQGDPSPIGQPSVNPSKRIMPYRMVRTNIPMIDLFNTLVVSQKLPIFAKAGEPYNELLARIALQADSDVIVIGGMGLKHDEYLKFRTTLDRSGALAKTVMFVHTSQLASRYEKAVDFDGAGSITILAVTTMPGGDVTHPVPDNTGYITEGQFYLSNGRIEPFGSLSRLKQQVNKNTREDHRTVMDAMIKLYSQFKETVEKQSMGFKMSDWDKKLLKYGADFEREMMDLSVNIPLEESLDLGWKILADNFSRDEVGIPSKLTDKFWPKGR